VRSQPAEAFCPGRRKRSFIFFGELQHHDLGHVLGVRLLAGTTFRPPAVDLRPVVAHGSRSRPTGPGVPASASGARSPRVVGARDRPPWSSLRERVAAILPRRRRDCKGTTRREPGRVSARCVRRAQPGAHATPARRHPSKYRMRFADVGVDGSDRGWSSLPRVELRGSHPLHTSS